METLLFTELTAETEDTTDEGLLEADFPLEWLCEDEGGERVAGL